jgi:hypothetical protein
MRKVTKVITDAFFDRRSRKCGNTRTDGTTVWLFDNPIAKWDGDTLLITLAGWDTATTRERLHGIGLKADFAIFRDRGVTFIGVRSDHDLSWRDGIVEMPLRTWITPSKFVGQFLDT